MMVIDTIEYFQSATPQVEMKCGTLRDLDEGSKSSFHIIAQHWKSSFHIIAQNWIKIRICTHNCTTLQ